MNILWLNTKIMFPLDQGGRIRTYHTLKHLKRRHNIAVVTLAVLPGEATAIPAMSKVCAELHVIPFPPKPRTWSPRFVRELTANLFSHRPLSLSRYRSRAMRAKVGQLLKSGLASGPVDLVVSDFLTPMESLPGRIDVPVVLFEHNVEAVIWERLAATQAGGLRRRYYRMQACRMHRCEEAAVRRADFVIAVSDDDCTTFRDRYGIDHVAAVPTGVDTDYFANDSVLPDEPTLVFVGSMDWMPNDDGAVWFMQEVLPRVRRSVPGAKLALVGKSPSDGLRRAADAAGGVTVTGRVDDVRPYLARARAAIVPLRVGGGTRIKIFEAMAAGRPVVSTTIGAEGLPVTHAEHLLIADSPADFAEAVVQVLSDDEMARRLARQGRDLVEERFGWRRAADAFAAILDRVAADRPRRHIGVASC